MKVIKNKHKPYFLLATTLIAGTLLYIFPPHFSVADAVTGTDKAEGETPFSVNVTETLSMTVTPPVDSAWAKGDVNQFLRNKVNVKVSSNSGTGFTAGMTTKTTDTSLVHTTASTNKIATMSTTATCADANCAAFPVNAWGYSLNDDQNKGQYAALVGSNSAPITVLSSATQASGEKNVYFGAKADSNKASGTYQSTVVFTVSSGTSGKPLPAKQASDPVPEEQGPSIVEPEQTQTAQQPQAYTYTTNNRSYDAYNYSYTAGDDTVAMADNNKKSAASDYIAPLGVIERNESNIQTGSVVTRVLMCVAFAAAGVGIFFFILAKRRKEDDEEEIQ